MTAQEYYELLVNAVYDGVMPSDEKNECLYRGPEGKKCAIGLLIPDEDYSPSFELQAVDELPQPLLDAITPEGLSIQDLVKIQYAHDALVRINARPYEFVKRFSVIQCFGTIPPLIGIMGVKRAGKDTIADFLCQSKYKYTKTAFAHKLKKTVADLFRLTLDEIEQQKIKDHPYGNLKIPVRETLIKIGELCRQIDPDVWLNHVRLRRGVVVSDVRYRNELSRIKQLGGITILVVRTGLPEQEAEVLSREEGEKCDLIDFVFVNDGSLDDLYKKVMESLSQRIR